VWSGCAHQLKPGHIVIKGELVSGAECPMVVTAEGKRYSLTGSLGAFKIGDRVCVRGTLAEVSYCMAGDATVGIEAIGPEDHCP